MIHMDVTRVAAPVHLEAASLDLGRLAGASTVLVVGIGLAVLLGVVVRRVVGGPDTAPAASSFIARFVQFVIVAATAVYALNTLGVRITPLLGALGIGGIAVALAVQSMLTNLIASIILQVRRPFRRGDQVAVTEGLEGVVEEVNLRTVRLRTFDGNDVMIPATMVLDDAITNYTRRRTRRTSLDVGMDYDTDLTAAREVMLSAMATVDEVLADPAPEAWVVLFGDNAITITLRYWHAPENAVLWRVRSEVAVAVKRDLDAAGMVIAFPQRVLHLSPEADRLTVDRSEPDQGR